MPGIELSARSESVILSILLGFLLKYLEINRYLHTAIIFICSGLSLRFAITPVVLCTMVTASGYER